MNTTERVTGEYLHLLPADDAKQHADDGWCWCAPDVRIASVSERLRTGAIRVVEHVAYIKRIAGAAR